MSGLARLSLGNRAVVALLTILIAGVGLFSMLSLKQELIPSITVPVTSVITSVPGADPEVVDEQVGKPLSNALKSVSGVDSVVATSSTGVSSVSVSSEFGIDQSQFKADLKAAVDSVQSSLPDGAEPDVVTGSIADLPVVSLSATSDASLNDLGDRLESSVVPELQAVDGVRDVSVSGEVVDRITITPDAKKLAAAGLTTADISQLLKSNGSTTPVGSIVDGTVSIPVQGGTAITSIATLAGLPVTSSTAAPAPGSTPKTLGDVATVKLVPQAATSITRTDGKESISLSITALPGAGVVDISQGVRAQLAHLQRVLGDGAHLTVVFDQAPFIQSSIEHLAIEGLLGLVFAVLVILLFLFSVRSTLVTAISIPLSVLITFIGLNVSGFSLNILTLGALTIALGRVVDDSIVVVENIKRQLSYGRSKLDAILTGVREVAGAITASTLTTVMVFLPIAFVGGTVGQLFRPFSLTVVIAMASSLFVALTIVPVLAFWFLGKPAEGADPAEVERVAEEKESRGRLQRAYLPILRGTRRHPVVTVVASAVLLIITVALIPLLKVDFLGSSGQNTLSVTQTFPTGTELTEIGAVAEKTEAVIRDTTGVDSVLLTAGRSSGGLASFGGGGSGTATFQVTTDPDADQAKLQSSLEKRIGTLAAADDITVGGASSGVGSSTVDVLVTAGDDEQALAAAATKVEDALQSVDHVTATTSDRTADQPTIQITANRKAVAEAGLTEMQLVGTVAGLVTPSSIGSISLDGTDVDVYVDNGKGDLTLDQLRSLSIPTAAGVTRLSDLASVERVAVPTKITRDGGALTSTVSLTPADGELGAVTSEVRSKLDDITLPAGTSVSIGGASQQQTDAFGQLGLAMLIAIAIVYLLMVATFRSLLQPLILLISIPFAATGAIGLLLITGRPLGVAALIGLLMLIGIVVTNAIVLIDLVNQFRRQGQSVQDALTNGTRKRLRPILMTAVATVFALLPMALGLTGSSGFISQDLAIVVIGGLVSSTVLTLILVPVLYGLVEGRRERRSARTSAASTVEPQHA